MIFKFSAHAEVNRTEIKVDFRVNSAHIDPGFSDNASKIKEVVEYIGNLQRDSSVTITSVTFCGTASPEGSYQRNRYLAGARLSSLERLIRERVDIPDSIITCDDSYIPWDYLREQLVNSSHEFKDTVISVIDEKPVLVTDPDNGKSVDRRVVRLKQLEGRRVWNELYRRYFDKMRNAIAVIITYKDEKDGKIVLASFEQEHPRLMEDFTRMPDFAVIKRSARESVESPAEKSGKGSIRMAVYTNMLYDVLAVPNIGLEFYLGRNWSVAGNWMYAWWSRDVSHRYWRVYGGDIGVRRWFGGGKRHVLSGHHVGLYGQMLTYDLETGGKGYLGDRWTWGGGVSYGYSLPIGSRLNIDFTIGIGYLGGEYKRYHPDDGCYVWESTHRLNWFGPTKAEVSLVWYVGPLGKGGGR